MPKIFDFGLAQENLACFTALMSWFTKDEITETVIQRSPFEQLEQLRQLRKKGNSETMSKALRNSKEVADKHYLKSKGVLPDVRRAVNAAMSGLIN